jgi:NitT/TauT family transport system permease protein
VTPIALITPASVWFGVNETATFVLVVYATTWPVTLGTCAGMRAIVPNRIRMARSFSADSFWLVARHVIMPSLIPHVVVGMRLGLSYSFMTVAGLEMLSGANGLGHLIYTERVFYRSDIMFAGIFLLGIMGFVGDRIFVFIMDRSLGRYSYGSGHR